MAGKRHSAATGGDDDDDDRRTPAPATDMMTS